MAANVTDRAWSLEQLVDRTSEQERKMPVRIIRAEGGNQIDDLDRRINDWLGTLEKLVGVKQIQTAMSQSSDGVPTFVATLWYKGPLDSN
jgi:hypothetical protein